jgi:hypothetical protein
MLSDLFKDTIIKFNENRNNLSFDSLRMNYYILFRKMFRDNMGCVFNKYKLFPNDMNKYYNYIDSIILSDGRLNDFNKKYDFKFTEQQEKSFWYLDTFMNDTIQYITRLCNIILDIDEELILPIEKNISEIEKQIITFRLMFLFLPVYYEIIYNCFEVYTIDEILEIEKLIKPLINIFSNNIKYEVRHGTSDFYFQDFEELFINNLDKNEMKELYNFIIKCNKEIKNYNPLL